MSISFGIEDQLMAIVKTTAHTMDFYLAFILSTEQYSGSGCVFVVCVIHCIAALWQIQTGRKMKDFYMSEQKVISFDLSGLPHFT